MCSGKYNQGAWESHKKPWVLEPVIQPDLHCFISKVSRSSWIIGPHIHRALHWSIGGTRPVCPLLPGIPHMLNQTFPSRKLLKKRMSLAWIQLSSTQFSSLPPVGGTELDLRPSSVFSCGSLTKRLTREKQLLKCAVHITREKPQWDVTQLVNPLEQKTARL